MVSQNANKRCNTTSTSTDDQWTVSIMHTKEDIQKTSRSSRQSIGEIKNRYVTPLPLEEAFKTLFSAFKLSVFYILLTNTWDV